MSLGLRDLKTKFDIAEDVFQQLEQVAMLLKSEKITFIDAATSTEVHNSEQVKKVNAQFESGALLSLSIQTKIEGGRI